MEFSEKHTQGRKKSVFSQRTFLDQQDEADRERITDTYFTVFGKVPKKYHLECESSLPDGKITIRLFEYDAQIVLDEGEVTEETLTVTFTEYNSDEQILAELKAEYQEILERFGEPERQGVIGAFDKRTIIELSNDVIKEIAQKYENVQKGVGGIMGVALIETSVRAI